MKNIKISQGAIYDASFYSESGLYKTNSDGIINFVAVNKKYSLVMFIGDGSWEAIFDEAKPETKTAISEGFVLDVIKTTINAMK